MSLRFALVCAATCIAATPAVADSVLDTLRAREDLVKTSAALHAAEAETIVLEQQALATRTALAAAERLYEARAINEVNLLRAQAAAYGTDYRRTANQHRVQELQGQVRLQQIQLQLALGQVVEPQEAQQVHQTLATHRCHRLAKELQALELDKNFAAKWVDNQRTYRERRVISEADFNQDLINLARANAEFQRAQSDYNVCDAQF